MTELHPELDGWVETQMAGAFRGLADNALNQKLVGDPRMVVRSMLRACYSVAFDKLTRGEAVAVLRAALRDLDAEHSKEDPPKP